MSKRTYINILKDLMNNVPITVDELEYINNILINDNKSNNNNNKLYNNTDNTFYKYNKIQNSIINTKNEK